MDWNDKKNLPKKQVHGFGIFLKIGSAAAFTAALIFRRNLAAEYSILSIFGILKDHASYPNSVTEWFFLYQEKPYIGLLFSNFFDLVNFILVGLFFSAVIILLFLESRIPAMTAAVLTATGIALSLFSNPSMALLSLSGRYGRATLEEQQNLLSAGKYLLKVHANNAFQGSGIYPSFFLVSTAGLMLSFMMLKSKSFNRKTAVLGILANVIGLSYYLFLVLLPGLAFLPLSVSAVFLLVWYILIGRILWRVSFRPVIPFKREQD